MTVASSQPVPRRKFLIGGLVACGVGAAGLAAYVLPALTRRRYAPTPFDDLLSKLPDRDSAAKVGAALRAETKTFDTQAAAQRLRKQMGSLSLEEALSADLVAGRTREIRGWIVPESLGMLCALAASAAPPGAGS